MTQSSFLSRPSMSAMATLLKKWQGVLAVGMMLIMTSISPALAMQFKVSQIGYHPNAPKIAYLEDVPEGVTPKVVVFDPKWKDRLEIFNGRKVFEVSKIYPVETANQAPGLQTYAVDFSDFATTGDFELRVDGAAAPIAVTEYLYWDSLKPILKTYYFQRSGQTLEDYRRNFYYYDCYTDDELFVKSPTAMGENHWDASGGWYDDGGFNKHVYQNSVAASRLLALYEGNANAFQRFKMDYPRGENALSSVPDMLNEAKIGSNWLMAMQRRNGAVLNGVTGDAGRCDARDDFELKERKVQDTTTRDTSVAAAVLGMAGRVYKAKDLGYAVKTLMAAEQAWDYLETQPVGKDDTLPRFWAAVELYATTGKPRYQQFIARNSKNLPDTSLQQSPMLYQALLDYALHTPSPQPEMTRLIRQRFLGEADLIAQSLENNPLNAGISQFSDNSNQILANRLNVLMAAYQLTQSPADQVRYQRAANTGSLYLFGLNPLGKTFVSGVGSDAVKHLSMQRFSADVLPGYLVAGPNSLATDKVTPKDMGVFSFVDNPRATSVNHISLLNSASLAYALGQLNTTLNYPSLNPLAKPEEPKETSGKKNKYPSLD